MASRSKYRFQTTFSTYTGARVIGEGGAGRIFEVVDDYGDKWAIKVLDSQKATREKTKRFRNELLFCQRNKHANIVTVVDHGRFINDSASSPFYVMPLYDGSLRSLLKAGIAPDEVLQYFSHILQGVEAAHLQGVIHRDLKPENILYDRKNDCLLVADFGIARFEEPELYTVVETQDAARLANFQYAAPEQRRRGASVDHRSDVYALGLILNEMFTGQIPLGTGYKTIGEIATDYGYLDDLVAEMLKDSAEQRTPSIEIVKRELIGRHNEFITLQRLSQLQNEVVPVSDIDDPIITDPPRLIGFDWQCGHLELVLSRPVNATWVWALRSMGSYTCLMGKDPEYFTFSGEVAKIAAREDEVQRVVNDFKNWLPRANAVYEERIRREKAQEEEVARQELVRLVAEQEARARVLKNVQI